MRRTTWSFFIVLASITTLNYIDRANFGIVVPILMRRFSWTISTVGVVSSLWAVGMLLGALPLSYMADRIPARRFLSWVVGLWSLCTATLGVSSVGWLFSLGRVGVGLFESPNFPVVTQLSGQAPNRRSGTALGINGIGTGLGLIVGGPLSGLLLASWGWRGMFVGEAILGFALIACWRWIASHTPVSSTAASAHIMGPSLRWDTAAVRRTIAMTVAVFGAVFIAFWTLAWFPLFLKTNFGTSVVASSFYLVLPGLGAASGALGGGLITDRARRRAIHQHSLLRWWGGGLLLLAGLAMISALWRIMTTTLIALFLANFFIQWLFVVIHLVAIDIGGPRATARVDGIVQGAYGAGAVLSPVINGLVIATRGFQHSIVVTGLVGLVSAISFVLLYRPAPRPAPSSAPQLEYVD